MKKVIVKETVSKTGVKEFPNPFNNFVEISYEIENITQNVNINIYNKNS